ncbi:putative nascent polypeptide-associated complex alpha subunit [Heterostelium album PN500]|uniref:Putative nascent polypeptide-associated complex alpha subunit n=1 Tax=Heterostelium pallidum (strain ATCC 26659 / Pp 5 / PN500) TaxID=670386 RepID=D3BN29_HETP5|nr:putative nascent polypeptide-associated complex alpha subunit [Heterostelium album PN500]EFA77391.1 putative nascent polypeptide-associated complex alpha subunit [Heterostelium album PN500]|eukprot:XP_020429520.1 putative nascent polypeptide-associated complex alpha subunit [Heterostelium album PN500]
MATIEEIPENVEVEEEETTTTTDANPQARKTSRGEKKTRGAMAKLGMKPVPDIMRVTLKSQGFLCIVAQPEVYKATGSDTYVILGETTFEDPNATRASKAAKKVEETAKSEAETTTTTTTATAEVDDEDVDLQGLDPKDVEVVMKEAKASKAKVVEALKKTGDIVSAVLELTS